MRTGLNSLSQNFPSSPSGDGAKSKIFIADVQSVNFTPPNYGEIKFESENENIGGNAIPIFPNISIFPIAGERVLIIDGKDAIEGNTDKPSLFSNVEGGVFFYLSILPLWANPSINAVNESTFISNNFPNSVVQNLKPLQSMPGDVLFQGRFGNSIRLGNTSRLYPNLWSSSGEVGNPITIINNGQSPASTNTENLSLASSSLYLTSNQQLSSLSLTNENFKSYTDSTKPITPAQYNSPQVILNSDRIILNAKNDSVLISGNKSVGISSNEDINIESKGINIYGNNIKLGVTTKNPYESAALGDTTVELLRQLTTEVRNISQALENQQIYPGGVGVPDPLMISVASLATPNLDKVLSKLDNIKSKFVKLK